MKIIFRLLTFLKRHRMMWFLALLCLTAGTAFSLVIPKVLGKGIDTVLNSGNSRVIILSAGIIIASSALRGIAGYGNRYYTEVISRELPMTSGMSSITTCRI